MAENFLLLEEQTLQYRAVGQVIICEDFNARCCGLRELDHKEVKRHTVDKMMNEQGVTLMEYIKNSGICFVSG